MRQDAEEVSEVHGKEDLATVAAFLPWRGSPVRSPWPLTKVTLAACGETGNRESGFFMCEEG